VFCTQKSSKILLHRKTRVFLISEFGPRSNCGYIIVISEIILISAPFLLILLAIEFHTDPTERIAALCRRGNALWGVIFFVLVLVQASMSSFGLNNVLCGQITADPNVDKCDRKLRFYHGPKDVCISGDDCQKPEKKIESFYSTLAALEACGWILFTIMFLFNFANVIGVSQRHEKYQLSKPVKEKPTTTTTTQNGQSKKTAPPAPEKSSPTAPPAETDSASLDFVTEEFPHRNPPEPMSLAQRDSVDA